MPNEPYSDFEGNCEVREQYVKWMIESLKNKYQRALENKDWEIILIFESKANNIIEQSIFELELN
jgi:hypothetical protein